MSEFDFGGDGIIDNKTTTNNTYDRRGNLVRSVVESDFNGDGNIDGRRTTSTTYDRRSNFDVDSE